MLSEFEEKQYEQHLNIELLQGNNLIFPPGQCLENVLGFDAALFTRHKDFWHHFLGEQPWYLKFFKTYLNGLHFPIEAFKLEDSFNTEFPQFKFNAFIQHKRPERMTKNTAAEWASWGQEYFRYKLLTHQQTVLEFLETTVGTDGIVTYASPAFHTKNEFWDTHKSQSFIKRSNFCQPLKLVNHHAYTYIEPGTIGIAHSEPENTESRNLLSDLERLSQTESPNDITNTEFLAISCNLLESSIKNQERYKFLYNKIIEDLDAHQQETPMFLRNLYKLAAFKFVTGISLYFGFNSNDSFRKIRRDRQKIITD